MCVDKGWALVWAHNSPVGLADFHSHSNASVLSHSSH